jgi:murein DD-endopeptidase MepM/ murein hydrolase activator NlpD
VGDVGIHRVALLLQSAPPDVALQQIGRGLLSKLLAILAQSAAVIAARSGGQRFAVAAVLLAVSAVAAFGIAPATTPEVMPTQRIQRILPLPTLAALGADETYWREERVRPGDTLGSMLARLGVVDAAAQKFLRTDPRARPLYQLRPGRALRVETDADGRLLSLRYAAPKGELLAIDRVGDAFLAQSAPAAVAVSLALRANEIRSSLFAAADAVGLPDAVTMQLAEIFSGDIDFLHDLRRGDRFSVVYEMPHSEGEPAGAGGIVAAEFVHKGVAYRAFRWQAPDGTESYYSEDGRSLKKAFLRSPVAFTRITSGFSQARFHPFLQTWRAHRGVDFAAPIGTPVHAASSGRVIISGQQGGYGNVVIVQHAGGRSTVYAHLSRFATGVKRGSHVDQGEVIGYVGMTGWATGPHLHYEFRVDNVQVNPLTIALPNARPVGAEQAVAYRAQIAPLAEELALGRGVVLAGGE